jgi:hypothetical protein
MWLVCLPLASCGRKLDTISIVNETPVEIACTIEIGAFTIESSIMGPGGKTSQSGVGEVKIGEHFSVQVHERTPGEGTYRTSSGNIPAPKNGALTFRVTKTSVNCE